MKRILLVLLLFCLMNQFSEAQLWKLKRYEVTAGFGPTVFFGDIGGFSHGENLLGLKDMSFLQTRFNFDFSLKFRITQEINARINFATGRLHATDERGSNEKRGYEASATFYEPSILGEYYFFKNKAENSYLFVSGSGTFFKTILSSIDLFAFTGIGGISYSVKGNDKLTGHGYKPDGFAAVIPLGLGATLIFSPNLNFGVELGGRYAFTDNLDGYTSQFSSSNDVYYFFNAVVTYKLKTNKNGLPSFRR